MDYFFDLDKILIFRYSENMQKIHTVGIIRNRGQLTIPDDVRTHLEWIQPSSVVTIISEKPDEIVIKPYSEKEVDWDKLWKQLKRIRAFKGKGRGNLSQFIAEDRKRH